MSDSISVCIRTIIVYFIILIIFRLMGKREIGELSLLDLIVFVMIAGIAVIGIELKNNLWVHSVLPMIILMLIQIGFAQLSLKSERFRHFLEGKPTIVINKGKIDEQAMQQQRYNFDDLLVQLREKNITNIADVDFAILETSGKLSVFEKTKQQLSFPLIQDGEIQTEHLKLMGRTDDWLYKQLANKGLPIEEISMCTFADGQLYVDEFGTKGVKNTPIDPNS